MPSPNPTPKQGLTVGITGALWALCVLTGTGFMVNEEFTAAPSAAIAPAFPRASSIALADDRPTLLLFLHPQCPCSRATMRELEKVMSRTQDKAAVDIVFTIPPGTPPGWEKGDLWDWANAIPGARAFRDRDGIATRHFGVVGSGHTLLYSTDGRLLFSGGITASRGEEGDNPGESAVIDFILTGHAAIAQTPVFGCALL